MHKSGLVELEAVAAIARHGSFRAAVLDLDMSPTAIGNAVASLEKRLGVRLFNRTTRNVALTSAGREYVEAIAPPELRRHECIRTRYPSGALYRWEFERRGKALRIDVPGSLTLDEPDMIAQASRAGIGLT